MKTHTGKQYARQTQRGKSIVVTQRTISTKNGKRQRRGKSIAFRYFPQVKQHAYERNRKGDSEMKTSLKIEHPGSIDFTMTITMPLSDWVRLQEQLNTTAYPASKLSEHIGSIVSKARKEFWENEEEQ